MMSACSHQPRWRSSAEHQAGLNGLAKPDFVGKQKSCRASASERERRLELKRQDVHRGALRYLQLAESANLGQMRMQVTHPAPPRRRADYRTAPGRDRAVER